MQINSHMDMDEIFEAGKNMAIALLPESVKQAGFSYNVTRCLWVPTHLTPTTLVNKRDILQILNSVYGNQSRALERRLEAYCYSDANEEILTLIRWLGLPQEYPDLEKLDRKQALKTLKVFQQAWQPSESLPRLREDLEKQIARVVRKGKWKFQDIGLLQAHYRNLQAVNSTHANAVKGDTPRLPLTLQTRLLHSTQDS